MTLKMYQWAPQKDITAYELALALSPISNRIIRDAKSTVREIEELPPEARRHFQVLE